VRIHDLRHSISARLIANGRILFELQSILGHSDPKVTMRYAHLSAKALHEAANAGSLMVPRANPKKGITSKKSDYSSRQTICSSNPLPLAMRLVSMGFRAPASFRAEHGSILSPPCAL
jgi:hypothetical protein